MFFSRSLYSSLNVYVCFQVRLQYGRHTLGAKHVSTSPQIEMMDRIACEVQKTMICFFLKKHMGIPV